MLRLPLTSSFVFLLSVLHSGDSGVSRLGEEAVVTNSAGTAPSAGRHVSLQPFVMSGVAEHLAKAKKRKRFLWDSL